MVPAKWVTNSLVSQKAGNLVNQPNEGVEMVHLIFCLSRQVSFPCEKMRVLWKLFRRMFVSFLTGPINLQDDTRMRLQRDSVDS